MDTVDNQMIESTDFRTGAEEKRIPAEENRTDAEKQIIVTNIAQININNIICKDRSSYNNGHFIPVFQDAIRAFACNKDVKPGTRLVLMYILGTVDENNCFFETIADIAKNLACSEDTVERAIKQLVSMQILCRKEGARERSIYELSDKILNPRFAFKGNTRKLLKEDMPHLLQPGSLNPLLPYIFSVDF